MGVASIEFGMPSPEFWSLDSGLHTEKWMESVDVFRYRKFSEFLREAIEAKKVANPRYSYAVLAKRVGLKSAATLHMIAHGERLPGRNLVVRLSKFFGLSERETDYLEHLVLSEKAAEDPKLKVLIDKKLSATRPRGKFRRIESSEIGTIANWYTYAIREMAVLPDFREDAGWISGRLLFEVSPADIRSAIEGLVSRGLLARDAHGRIVQSALCADTPSDIVSEGLKQFHEVSLANVIRSVRVVPIEEREITGTTLAVSSKQLERAKTLIRDFQKQFVEMIEETSGNADSVYELKVAFYPLTKKGECS